MSTKDYITTLLDVEDVVLENIEEDAREITIELELKQRMQLCPACWAAPDRIHDDHKGSGSSQQADDALRSAQAIPLPRMREEVIRKMQLCRALSAFYTIF